jgi:hypothetical protein
MTRKKREPMTKVINAGRAESPKDPVDPDILEEFEEAQKLGGSGARQLERKLKDYTDRGPELSGGDIDAEWERADIGEECVSGDNPTPDQSVVQDIGDALGETQDDEKPLQTADKRHQKRRPVDPAKKP